LINSNRPEEAHFPVNRCHGSVQEVRDALAKGKNQDSAVLLLKRDPGSLFVALAR
jgi:hypothetical protein